MEQFGFILETEGETTRVLSYNQTCVSKYHVTDHLPRARWG